MVEALLSLMGFASDHLLKWSVDTTKSNLLHYVSFNGNASYDIHLILFKFSPTSDIGRIPQ